MRTAIVVERLGHVYPDGTEALKGVSLAIGSGDYLALCGPNGSGKSTLARHLNGLLKPTEGRVLIGDLDTRTRTPAELAPHVGYLFQNPNHQLVAPTVEQEVAIGPRARGLSPREVRNRVAEALGELGIEELRSEHPLFLTLAQKQLVAIASLLALRPSVLVLDEPTTALDATERRRVMEIFDELWRAGRAIVLITHEMDLVAEHARRCAVLADGRMVFDGDPEGLFSSPEVLELASLERPQIAELGARLGASRPWLTVGDALRSPAAADITSTIGLTLGRDGRETAANHSPRFLGANVPPEAL
jgi:energy-coupling factor transport system ATP-binding protein